ncbi:MAG: phosphotransferase [Woeseiaceae bacterium]
MSDMPAAVDALSVPQPQFSEAVAHRTLAQDFGLEGELTPLVSERDQNFRLTTADGRRFVFKIANSSESKETTDLQIKVLLHIESRHCPVNTPILCRTLSGHESSEIIAGDMAHVCRVVSYVPGTLLSDVDRSPTLAESFGQSAARLDLALQDFSHPADSQTLLWDLQRAGELRALLTHVQEPELLAAVSRCLDDFEQIVEPALPSLRRQVIHADLNPDNVLADSDDHEKVAGVIDFGDMTRAPLVVEVAVAAAYLRVDAVDALAFVQPFVAGFHGILPLQREELGLLFDLIRIRLAATITILRWRAATRGHDDDYSRQFLQSERSAEVFLARIDAMGRSAFSNGLYALS